MEPELTNLLLQAIYKGARAVQGGQNQDGALKKTLQMMDGGAEPKAEAKPEKSAPPQQ